MPYYIGVQILNRLIFQDGSLIYYYISCSAVTAGNNTRPPRRQRALIVLWRKSKGGRRKAKAKHRHMHYPEHNTASRYALPEIASLPCACVFAVCFLSGTRQRATLPCATTKTHGKKKHTAKSTLYRVLAHGKDFAVCIFFAHSKLNS